MKKIYLFLLLGLTFPVFAQEFKITQTKAPEQTPFAKPFDIAFTLEHPSGGTVKPLENSFSPDFEIVDTKFSSPTENSTVVTFNVIPFALQASTFTVTFDLLQNGTETAQTATEVPLTVTPVNLFNDKEIKEIRPPHIPFSLLLWFLILLITALVAALLVWLSKRKQQIQTLAVAKAEDSRPPHEVALSQIDALVDSGLWEQKQYKIFYITLSDILRQYLWRQFKLDTFADTSVELLRRARTCKELEGLLPQLKEFLNEGDLVKFAKFIPTEEARNHEINTLRTLIHQTTPVLPETKEKNK